MLGRSWARSLGPGTQLPAHRAPCRVGVGGHNASAQVCWPAWDHYLVSEGEDTDHIRLPNIEPAEVASKEKYSIIWNCGPAIFPFPF